MKRIGTLNNIPIVEGDANELKINNILYDKKENGIDLLKRGDDGKLHSISSGSSSLFKYYEIPDIYSDDFTDSTSSMLNILSLLPVFSTIYGDEKSLKCKLVNNLIYNNSSASDFNIDTAVVSPFTICGNNYSYIGMDIKGFCLYTGKQILGSISDNKISQFIELEGDLASYLYKYFNTGASSGATMEQIQSIIAQSNIKEISESEYLNLLNKTVNTTPT